MMWLWWVIGGVVLIAAFVIWHAFAIFGQDDRKDFWKALKDEDDDG